MRNILGTLKGYEQAAVARKKDRLSCQEQSILFVIPISTSHLDKQNGARRYHKMV